MEEVRLDLFKLHDENDKILRKLMKLLNGFFWITTISFQHPV